MVQHRRTSTELAGALQRCADAGSSGGAARLRKRRAPSRGAALGLIPFWAKDARIAYSTINAMAETLATKPAFRDAFKSRRCLVPADGFYEWKKLDAKAKQPYRIVIADGTPMALAGLWERWRDPMNGETVKSFTIIITSPNALCAPIHNRMPVIIDPSDFPAWLGETSATPVELQALLRPFPAERMAAHEIGPEIGNVRTDHVGLIEPA